MVFLSWFIQLLIILIIIIIEQFDKEQPLYCNKVIIFFALVAGTIILYIAF